MKYTRTTLAVLAILVLMASAFLPGGALPLAVLAVVVLVLPLLMTFTRRWAVVSSTHSDPDEISLVLLRAPPAPSFER